MAYADLWHGVVVCTRGAIDGVAPNHGIAADKELGSNRIVFVKCEHQRYDTVAAMLRLESVNICAGFGIGYAVPNITGACGLCIDVIGLVIYRQIECVNAGASVVVGVGIEV